MFWGGLRDTLCRCVLTLKGEYDSKVKNSGWGWFSGQNETPSGQNETYLGNFCGEAYGVLFLNSVVNKAAAFKCPLAGVYYPTALKLLVWGQLARSPTRSPRQWSTLRASIVRKYEGSTLFVSFFAKQQCFFTSPKSCAARH